MSSYFFNPAFQALQVVSISELGHHELKGLTHPGHQLSQLSTGSTMTQHHPKGRASAFREKDMAGRLLDPPIRLPLWVDAQRPPEVVEVSRPTNSTRLLHAVHVGTPELKD